MKNSISNHCDNKPNKIDISIIIITYNHENFIKQSIESVLLQKHNLNVEILIGDDCSTDNTPKILQELEKEYLNRLFVYYNRENVGASKNLYNLFTKARGKYITILEGDDYWIDINKINIMYNYLENHNNLYGVSHVRNRINHDEVVISKDPRKNLINKTINLADYQKNKNFSLMSTMFKKFDNDYLEKYHNAFVISRNACDFVIMIMILNLGSVKILPYVLGAYRINSNPLSYCVSNTQDKVLYDKLMQSRELLKVTNNKWFNKQIGIIIWRIFVFYIKRNKTTEWRNFYNSLSKEEKAYFVTYFFSFVISLLDELFKI